MKTKVIRIGLPNKLQSMDPAELRALLIRQVIKQREHDFVVMNPERKLKVIRLDSEYAEEIRQQAEAYNMSIAEYTAALLNEGV